MTPDMSMERMSTLDAVIRGLSAELSQDADSLKKQIEELRRTIKTQEY